MRPLPAFLFGAALAAILAVGVVWVEMRGAAKTLRQWADSTQAVDSLKYVALNEQRQAAQQEAAVAAQAVLEATLLADQAQAAQQAGVAERTRLRASLAAATTGRDSLPFLVVVVRAQDSQIVQLTVEVKTLRSALRSEIARSFALTTLVAIGDSALVVALERVATQDSVIRSWLVPSPTGKFFGFFPKPSSEVTFLIGLIVGVVATRSTSQNSQ